MNSSTNTVSFIQNAIWFTNLVCFSLALMPFATDTQRLWLLGIPTGILALFSIPNLFFKRKLSDLTDSSQGSVQRAVGSISSTGEPTQGDVSDNSKMCAALLVHIHTTQHTQPLLKYTPIFKTRKAVPVLRALFTDVEIVAASAFLTQLKMQAALEGVQAQQDTDPTMESAP